MKENDTPNDNQFPEEEKKENQIVVTNPQPQIQKPKLQLKRVTTMNQYINITLDNIGFTRYHLLLFLTNALFLFCEGMHEIIHIILLSMINEKHKLSHYHLAFMNSIEYLGYTISTLLVTSITNIIKRKHAILISVFLSLVCTGLSITSYNFIFASVNRFILGFCFGVLDILIYLNLFESLPTKIRGFISTMILLFFPLGEFALSLVCYFKLKEGEDDVNYKFMLLFPFVFTVIVCLSAMFLQESPRELFFGKQEYMKGVESFKKISEFNRDSVNKNKFNFGEPEIEDATKNIKYDLGNLKSPENGEAMFNEENNIQGGLLTKDSDPNSFKMNRFRLLFNSEYWRYTILFWIIGSFSGFIFYGIHFMLPATAPKINKNTFLDLVLFESMEIPPNFFAMLLIENKEIGRKNTIRIGLFITFFISLINVYLGETILLFDCLLKFALTVPLNVLFVYTSEIYDSHVRTMGLSLMNFWKKISSLFSPFFMSYILYEYGEFATHLCYGPLLIVCAIGSLFLTIETRGRALDEVIPLEK